MELMSILFHERHFVSDDLLGAGEENSVENKHSSLILCVKIAPCFVVGKFYATIYDIEYI